jgi:hypothetical protein
MAEDREELLLEAESRGLLPADKQEMLDELRSRGGIMSRQEYEIRTDRNTPDYRPQGAASLPSGLQRFSDMITDPIGVQDEMVGAGQFVRKLVTTGSLDEAGKAYSEGAERIRAERRVARDEGGVPGMAAELVASAGTAGPARVAQAALPLVQRALQTAKAGASFGAVAGAAQSEGGVGNRVLGAGAGAAIGGIAGPVLSEAIIPGVIRTGVGIRNAVRYGNQAVRNARNPQQAAVENVADRMVGAGVDPAAVRAQVSPPPSNALARRGLTEENMADIVSRSLAGEDAAAIGQQYGINPGTVRAYVRRYQEGNPTPMNIMDISKEVAGDGGAAPVTRLGRAAYSLAGDDSGEAAQRLVGRQDTQAGRVSNIVQRSVAGGDFEATRAAGLQTLRNEADTAYRQFYQEPDLGIDQLDDLMADPLFRRANIGAQRQARVETIRRNQEARRAGRPEEPVPEVDPQNQVFSPEMLDLIQRQLRITAEGHASNLNAARHARNLREVFLDRIEDHYPTFQGIRQNYATGMGEFGEEGALAAGEALTTKMGANAREALRGFDDYTPAQQELFRLGFARSLMDKAANPQIGGAVANQFNTTAVREIVERLYPRADRQLHVQGQRLLRDLRREATTTRTKNDVMSGARTAELGSDMGRMMEGTQTAADVATGRWGKLLENLSTRLSTQLGRRGAREVLDLLTETDPARLLPTLNRLSQAAATSAERQAYVAALREIRSIGVRRLSGIIGQNAGALPAITDQRGQGR